MGDGERKIFKAEYKVKRKREREVVVQLTSNPKDSELKKR